MNHYLTVLRKYAVFSGRARRAEYWMFFLFNFLAVIALTIVGGIIGDKGVLSGIYQVGVLIPSIAVGVRRMHDTDHRGWWLLLPVVNFVFAVIGGDRCENRFGPDPKAIVK